MSGDLAVLPKVRVGRCYALALTDDLIKRAGADPVLKSTIAPAKVFGQLTKCLAMAPKSRR
jgi:hypothetical protein